MLIEWFKQNKARKAAAQGLYQAALGQSRDPVFYERLGVADTLDGRFDLASLHAFLVMERLKKLGPKGDALAQAVFDRMFKTIDLMLREIGVGDLGVPKHMQRMMKAFNGRVHVYDAALQSGNQAALELALIRNIYRAEGEAVPPGAEAMADYVLRADSGLQGLTLDDFMAGRVTFPAVVLARKEAAYA